MTDVFLYAGEANPSDVKLRDPTIVSGKQNYVLTCAAGTYSYSGVAAGLTYTPGAVKVDYTLACASGAYTYSGVASTALKVEHKLTCDAGSYAYSGVSTTSLKVAHSLQCSSGAYGLSGSTVTLTYQPGSGATAYALSCEPGSYEVVGVEASLIFSGKSPAQSSGGGFYWTASRKTQKRIDEDRKRLGITPEDIGVMPQDVAQAVVKVAESAIQKATDRREPDVLSWLLQEQQRSAYEQQIRSELDRSNRIWDAAYAHLFELAVIEALQQEEEAILMLMLEL